MKNMQTKQNLIQYIYEHWKGTRKQATAFVCKLEMLAQEHCMQECMFQFQAEYRVDMPLEYLTVWGFLLEMMLKDESDPERFVAECASEFEQKGKAEADAAMIHLEDLPYREQTAFYKLVNEDGDWPVKEQCSSFCEMYPNLEESSYLLMRIAMDQRDWITAKNCYHKLEGRYGNALQLLQCGFEIYRNDEDQDAVGELCKIAERVAARIGMKDKGNAVYSLLLGIARGIAGKKCYNSAARYYRYLIEYWNEPESTQECWMIENAFVEFANFPTEYLVGYMDAFVSEYTRMALVFAQAEFLTKQIRCDMIGTTVITLAGKLQERKLRPRFQALVEELDRRRILDVSGYRQIISSAYGSLESYRLNDDERIPLDLRIHLLPIYEPDTAPAEVIAWNADYLSMDTSMLQYIRESYPILAPRLMRSLNDAKTLRSRMQKEFNMMTAATYVRAEKKVGRNEPCPCGSGKKYKQCCGKSS